MNKRDKRALLVWYLLLAVWAVAYFDGNRLTPMPYTDFSATTKGEPCGAN